MPWSFDNIPKYVINLDRRSDRWNTFQQASGIDQINNLRRWSGTDGKLLNIDADTRVSLFTKYNIVRSTRRSHMELNTKGGVGCYISHTEVWKHFLEKGNSEVGMIIEDDAVMDSAAVHRIKTFIASSDVIKNNELWDFCILAPHLKNKKHGPMYPGDETCLRLMEFSGLTGYLFTKRGVRKALPHIFPIQVHLDWFLSICTQLQMLDICTPTNSLIRIRPSRTDIQKYNDCDLCDIEPDYKKDSTLITKWRLKRYEVEEILLLLGALFLVAAYVRKI